MSDPTLPSSGAPMSSELKRYTEGELCVELNKRVQVLIVSTSDFFIFLDDDLYVQWLTVGHFDLKPASVVLNQISYLETISTTHFSGVPKEKTELAEFRRLLGECLARAFDGNVDSARELLESTEQLLHERSAQRARQWYLTAAVLTTLLPVVGSISLWLGRVYLRAQLGSVAFDVLLCACLGGIGALVSTIVGVRKINLNASFGPNLHYIEGGVRIIAGTVGGSLAGLAIKGNLLFGSLNAITDPSIRLACVCTVALIAGRSERLVPNLIKRVEKTALDEERDRSATLEDDR